uniref:fatty acid amide hydrolase n=1 Tax=Panagrellus redivivus TaxID=6233 RepID=A0A7E4W9L1_PANRE
MDSISMSVVSTLKPPTAITVAVVAVSLITGYFGFRIFRFMKHRASLRQKVSNRQAEREKNFEAVKRLAEKVGVDAVRREAIIRMTPDELRTALRQREVKCQEVLAAYVQTALAVNERLNCVTLFVLEAFDRALELDNNATDNTYDFPNMFGIPISIKESVQVRGYDQTLGYASEIGNKADDNSKVINLLLDQGFIPFALTNVPLSLLSFGCKNPIYGTTLNPFNPNRTCGGSSGGEGALIGGGGSIVGIGGDVGGSIRIPAHFSGICGIKPSHLRMTTNGLRGSIPGRPLVNASEGPMATTVDMCAKVLQGLFVKKMSKMDPYVPPVPFADDLYNSTVPLKIGYYVDDGYFPASVPVARAVEEAAEALRKKGHEVIRFQPPRIPEVFGLYFSALFIDGGCYISDRLSGDLFDPHHLQIILMPYLPKWLFAPLLNRFGPKAEPMTHVLGRTLSEQRKVYAAIEGYRHEFVKVLQSNGFDAILCPPNAGPAYEHGLPDQLAPTISYTAIFNLLDYAAGVVQYSFVNDDDIANNADFKETDHFTKILKRSISTSKGLPLGVQVAAPPYSEEVVLRVMRIIEEARDGH